MSAVAVAQCALLSAAPADPSAAPVAAPQPVRSPLRYGGDADFPPYEWLDERGVAHGFQVDLIRALAQKLNVDVEVRLGPWHEIYADFLAGEIDVVTMAERPERHAAAEFCEPHAALVSEVFVREGSPTMTEPEDLIGKEIVVEEEALAAHVIAQRLPDVKLILVPTQADALRLIASGRHDAAIASQANGRRIIESERLDNLRSTGPVVLVSNYSFCTRKGDVELRHQINDALNALKQEEQYGRMYSKWLGPQEGVAHRTMLKWAAFLGLPLAALLGAWAVWTRTLRAQVAQRTASLREELQARQRAEAEVRLLLNELDHRVRNLLASIVSLAEQQPAGDRPSAQFRSDLVGRVRAMATAHGAMRIRGESSLTIDSAIRTLARQFGPDLHERIKRDGPDVSLPPEVATPLCMVFHELVSNAMRHGALSTPAGFVVIYTSQRADGIEIRWVEDCAGQQPRELRTGFGVSLMEGLIVYQLRGTFRVHMTPHGLEAEFFAPTSRKGSDRSTAEEPTRNRGRDTSASHAT